MARILTASSGTRQAMTSFFVLIAGVFYQPAEKESGDLQGKLQSALFCNGEVLLEIGEQIERLVEAADEGNSESFVVLVER